MGISVMAVVASSTAASAMRPTAAALIPLKKARTIAGRAGGRLWIAVPRPNNTRAAGILRQRHRGTWHGQCQCVGSASY